VRTIAGLHGKKFQQPVQSKEEHGFSGKQYENTLYQSLYGLMLKCVNHGINFEHFLLQMSVRRLLHLFNLFLSIFGIGAFLVGTFLIIDATDISNFPTFAKTNCTLTKAQIVEIPDCGFIVIWSSGGFSAIESPFSVVSSRLQAVARSVDYPLLTPLECFCSQDSTLQPSFPSVSSLSDQCGIWGGCMLNVKMTEYIQSDGARYQRWAEILLAFSTFALIAGITLSIITCFCGSCLECGSSERNYRGIQAAQIF
jgi:hypothetical protein